MSIRNRILTIYRSPFFRATGVLIGGTAVAQAISLLVLPILTRLYSPEDFGVLAVYASLLGIMGSIATLRFELAIPLAESDSDAANLLVLAILIAFLLGLISFGVLLILPDWVTDLLKQPSIKNYLYLLPVGIFFTGGYAALQYWAVRKNDFLSISRTKIYQSILGSGLQLGFGHFGLRPFGLLLGPTFNSFGGLIGLGRAFLKNYYFLIKTISWRKISNLIVDYKRFPTLSTFEALANNINIQLPIVLIALMSSKAEAGYLALAMMIMQGPSALIGGAISQVYFSKAPQEYKSSTLGEFTAKTLLGLFCVGVGPMLFVGILAPDGFALIFGEKWRRAGEVVSWLIPWFALQLLVSPVSMSLHVAGKQAMALILQLFGLALRVGSVILMGLFARNFLVEMYAISGAVFYLVYLIVVGNVVALNWNDVGRKIWFSGIKIALLWIVFAIALLCIEKLYFFR